MDRVYHKQQQQQQKVLPADYCLSERRRLRRLKDGHDDDRLISQAPQKSTYTQNKVYYDRITQLIRELYTFSSCQHLQVYRHKCKHKICTCSRLLRLKIVKEKRTITSQKIIRFILIDRQKDFFRNCGIQDNITVEKWQYDFNHNNSARNIVIFMDLYSLSVYSLRVIIYCICYIENPVYELLPGSAI